MEADETRDVTEGFHAFFNALGMSISYLGPQNRQKFLDDVQLRLDAILRHEGVSETAAADARQCLRRPAMSVRIAHLKPFLPRPRQPARRRLPFSLM